MSGDSNISNKAVKFLEGVLGVVAALVVGVVVATKGLLPWNQFTETWLLAGAVPGAVIGTLVAFVAPINDVKRRSLWIAIGVIIVCGLWILLGIMSLNFFVYRTPDRPGIELKIGVLALFTTAPLFYSTTALVMLIGLHEKRS